MIRPSYNYPALRLISGMFQLVCVAAVLASAGCGSGDMTVPTDALSGDLNKAISLSETKSDAGKTQVLVYCVNEPNAAAYAQIRDWLREEGGEEFVRVADWIEGDLERFPNAVDQELSQIRQHAPLDTGVAIVSNALLREGRFLQKPAGSGEYVSVPFKATESGELLPHPVTDPAVFAKIIDQLAATFPPENHEFNLITKSHGSDEFAMATSMGQVLDVPSKEMLLERIHKFVKARGMNFDEDGMLVQNGSAAPPNSATGNTLDINSDTTMDARGSGKLDINSDTTMGAAGSGALDINSDTTMSGKIMLTGLTKDDYFRVIKERGTNNSMRFPVIFLESCRSELSEDLLSQLRGESTPLIGSLYTSNETGLRFTTIDYPQLLKQSAEKDQNLATALVDHLAEIQSTQVPIPTE